MYDANGDYQGDYFAANDYRRIKGNLEHLFTLAKAFYTIRGFPEIPNVTETSFGYASYINALENALEVLKTQTTNPGIGTTKIWQGNSQAPLYSDLNRIESACLLFYKMYNAQKDALKKLEFEMGGNEF